MAVSRTSADHAAHDELMLAVVASGDDLPAEELAEIEARLRDCAECALVVSDLRAIQAATADLPAPPRRRDYGLTEADIVRLRPSPWRRFVEAFGSSRDRVTAPAAAGLATLGVAGLLLVSMGQVSSTVNVFGTAGSAVDGAAGAASYSTTSGVAPEAAGGSAPGLDQETIRAGQGAATEAPLVGTKLAPVAPGATAVPAENAQPAQGAGDGAGAATAAPAATEGPAMMALPAASAPPVGASAAPEAARLPSPAEMPAATAAPAPPLASERGPSPVAVVALLSLIAIAAAVVLVVFRLVGRRLAAADRR